MIVPTIHLNGTSREELFRQLSSVTEALDNVLDKMSNAVPHGRDYYPQGDDGYKKAIHEHIVRVNTVTALRNEYMALMEKAFVR